MDIIEQVKGYRDDIIELHKNGGRYGQAQSYLDNIRTLHDSVKNLKRPKAKSEAAAIWEILQILQPTIRELESREMDYRRKQAGMQD